MATNEIATQTTNKAQAAVSQFSSGEAAVYSSIQGTDQASRLSVLDAITNAESISDHLGKTIFLCDFVVQAVEVTDEVSGEMVDAVRAILIDDKGGAYAAVSNGILKALQNLVGVLGQPSTWTGPIPIRCEEVKGRGARKFYTIKVAPAGTVKK